MFESIEFPADGEPPVGEPPFDPSDCDPEELTAWLESEETNQFDDCDGISLVPDPVLESAAAAALDDLDDSEDAKRLEELDADATLAEAAASKTAAHRIEVRQVALAAHWADLHAMLTRPDVKVAGCERLVRLGGDGTPEVAEFAPAEFGAVLGIRDAAASSLVADALDLRHRFPLLWQTVRDGFTAVWLARRTVDHARPLSKAAAAAVDARIAGLAGTVTWRRLHPILDAAIIDADPPRALSDADRAAAEAGVWRSDDVRHGYGSMFIKAKAGDLSAFDDALDVIARAIKILGDDRGPDQRRAAAVGILAHPHTAQDLVAEAERVRQAQRDAAAARRNGDLATAESIEATLPDHLKPTPESPASSSESETSTEPETSAESESSPPRSKSSGAGGAGPSGDSRRSGVWRRPVVFGQAVLYYHLTRDTLDKILTGQEFAGAGVVRVDDIGPVIADHVRHWLQHANVTVKPVIDLADIPPVDHYETTPAIAEAIRLINPADSSPYSSSLSKQMDNDHTQPYLPMNKGGPPGQTDPLKMAGMTRRWHRIKTFGGWAVTQVRPGARLFRSPHGYHYLIDQHGTTALGQL